MVRHDQLRNFYEYLCVGLFLCVTAIQLCACGGGGSSSTPPPPQNPLPAIASISPTSFTAGASAAMVTITGSGFMSSSTAGWNQSSRPTTYVSSIQLQVALTAADIASGGTRQITVLNPAPGGGVSTWPTLTIDHPVPAISKVSPASALAGSSDTLLDVSGSGSFPSTVIAWNGTALATTFVSATELKATLPAADLTGSSASQITAQNPAPGGGPSAAATFNVNSPAPVITAISPRIVPPGAAATITNTGTGFESNSVAL
jgi:trimeric autotransporter adhesin